MADILCIGEVRGGELKRASLEICTAAAALAGQSGGTVSCALAGKGVKAHAGRFAEFGAARVHVADSPALEPWSNLRAVRALKGIVDAVKPNLVLLPVTITGKDVAPRLAARLGVACASDCVGISWTGSDFRFERPMYGGRAMATVEFSKPGIRVATFRPNVVFPMAAAKPGAGEVVDAAVPEDAADLRAVVKAFSASPSQRPELTEAPVIVSGGRAMGSAEKFKVLEELADVLGAAVGASRAAVDSGYAPVAVQVGQTGKTVNPSLYIACGISGAIQHLAGMRTSKVLVAINRDPGAPIFKVADYGIVGDLFEIVPLLTAELKKMRG